MHLTNKIAAVCLVVAAAGIGTAYTAAAEPIVRPPTPDACRNCPMVPDSVIDGCPMGVLAIPRAARPDC